MSLPIKPSEISILYFFKLLHFLSLKENWRGLTLSDVKRSTNIAANSLITHKIQKWRQYEVFQNNNNNNLGYQHQI